MAKLIDNRDGSQYDIVTNPVRIGRHPSNEIVLNGPCMSRFHAQIETDGDSYFVQDLHSTYGSTLNGEQFKGHVAITNGDRIGFGMTPELPEGGFVLTFSMQKASSGSTTFVMQTSTDLVGQADFEIVEGVLVVKVTGAFRQPECEAVLGEIQNRLAASPTHVVMVFEFVSYVNDYIAGPIMALAGSLVVLGKSMTLAVANEDMINELTKLGLIAQLGAHSSVFEAVEAVNAT